MRIQQFKTPLFMAVLLGLTMLRLSAQTYYSVGLNQPPLLVADVGNDFTICQGDTLTIGGAPTAIGGTAPYNYGWTPSIPGLTGSNPTISPGVTTTFYLMLSDANICSALDSMTVTVDTCVGLSPSRNVRLAVYPNPTNGMFRVDVQSLESLESMQLEVSDALGKTVFLADLPAVNGRHSRDIDFSSMGRGVYFIRVQAGSQQISQKLILR